MRLTGGLAFNGSVDHAGAKLEVYRIKRDLTDPPIILSPYFCLALVESHDRPDISRGARVTAETEACRGKLTRRTKRGRPPDTKKIEGLSGSLRSGAKGIVLRDCGESDDQLTFLIFPYDAPALM